MNESPYYSDDRATPYGGAHFQAVMARQRHERAVLIAAWREGCGVLLAKRASDRNRMHFDCWADHHCGPDSPWPPGHQCRTPRSDG